MFAFFKRPKLRRRETLRAQPFPAEWRQTLVNRFPLFNRLPATDQRELEGYIQVFLAEKNFEGCGGFQITDENGAFRFPAALPPGRYVIEARHLKAGAV